MSKIGNRLVVTILARLVTASVIVVALQASAPRAVAQSLDFETYRTKVEPIFLKKRPTHARCVACHAAPETNTAFHLQPLSPGSSTWTEEQSRRNFVAVSAMVTPGNPAMSHLLMHPLAPEAGGDYFHGGGRQFASQKDPEWQTIAAWVRQAAK